MVGLTVATGGTGDRGAGTPRSTAVLQPAAAALTSPDLESADAAGTSVVASRLVASTRLGSLLQGCGVAWLQARPPASVDLVVADPPYGLGKATWDRFASGEAYLAWTHAWVSAAHRALRDTGSLYVMGFSEVLAQVLGAVASDWTSVRWLVWHYRNKANLKDDWGRSHESVLHLRKGRRFTFNTDAVRVPYNAHTTRYPERTQADTSQYGGARSGTRAGAPAGAGARWRPHPLGARPRDVIEVPVLCNGTAEKTLHPTQKPVQLVRKLVLASSNPGDLVVDPFAGSGTTCVVAEAAARRWVALELDATYARVAAERLRLPTAFEGLQTRASEDALARRRGRLRAP